MKGEIRIFLALGCFFLLASVSYGFLTYQFGHDGLEPVGTAAIFLTSLLVFMIGGYLWVTARRIDPRPEDNPLGNIEDLSGDQGGFAPWSWWPLVLGLATAITFLGLAAGWWLVGIGVIVGLLGLIGWVFEFSRGQHAH